MRLRVFYPFAGWVNLKPMPDFKPNPGFFLPLLESTQRRGFGPKAAAPITLLEILERQSEGAPGLFDLQTREGMEPARYRESLKSLRDAG
jgi:hypothetical protein